MRKILILLIIPLFSGCAELQQLAEQIPTEGNPYVTNAEVAAGLREALNLGIERQVSTLAREGGFFSNDLVRITLPAELQKVDRTLRNIGLGDLADEGLKVLNRAAEDAVQEATPIFVEAVKEITFEDARNILTGNDTAATAYLEEKTADELYSRFLPIIGNSLEEVGATRIWANIINRYNQVPLTSPVNPNLAEYVTLKAQEGVFTMIALEEKQIRNDFAARTTDLLRKIFALQD